jgi:hypothetical protein
MKDMCVWSLSILVQPTIDDMPCAQIIGVSPLEGSVDVYGFDANANLVYLPANSRCRDHQYTLADDADGKFWFAHTTAEIKGARNSIGKCMERNDEEKYLIVCTHSLLQVSHSD